VIIVVSVGDVRLSGSKMRTDKTQRGRMKKKSYSNPSFVPSASPKTCLHAINRYIPEKSKINCKSRLAPTPYYLVPLKSKYNDAALERRRKMGNRPSSLQLKTNYQQGLFLKF
jgi:hypothetical protein